MATAENVLKGSKKRLLNLVPKRSEEGYGETILARAFLLVDSHQGFLHLDYGERGHQRRLHAGLNNGRGVPPHLAAAAGAGGSQLLLEEGLIEVGSQSHDLLLI